MELGQVRPVNRLIPEHTVNGEVLGGLETTLGKPADHASSLLLRFAAQAAYTTSHEEAEKRTTAIELESKFTCKACGWTLLLCVF